MLTTLTLPGVRRSHSPRGPTRSGSSRPGPDLTHAHSALARRRTAEPGASGARGGRRRRLHAAAASSGGAAGARRPRLGASAGRAGLAGERSGRSVRRGTERAGGDAAAGLAELRRLGLAPERHGVWRAQQAAAAPAPDRLEAMADAAAGHQPRRARGAALCAGAWEPAAAWCEERLERGAFAEARAVAAAAAVAVRLRLAAAEGGPRPRPSGRGRDAAAGGSGGGAGGALARPRRVVGRGGGRERAGGGRTCLGCRRAARAAGGAVRAGGGARGPPPGRPPGATAAPRTRRRAAPCLRSPEVEIELAAWEGASGLRALARRKEPRWRGDDAARLLHVTSSAALDRGSRPAAMTGLRAALRAASGENPHLLGEIHADLACTAILAEQPGSRGPPPGPGRGAAGTLRLPARGHRGAGQPGGAG